MRRKWIEAVFVLCMFAQVFLSAQEKPAAERFRLVYADSLVGMISQGKPANKLSGKVQMIQGTAYLNCSEAIWYEKENRISLLGDVVIYDGKRTLQAERVDYDGDQKIEKAFGNVKLENDHRKISASILTYFQNEEQVTAEGGARAEDVIEKVILKGNLMFYDRKKDYCRVENSPFLMKTDTVSNKTWTLSGKIMQAWGKEQRALISDSVVIDRDEMRGTCRKAEYYADPNRLILTGAPVIRQNFRKMQGDSMVIRLNQNRFEGSVIIGKAEILSSDSTGNDRLKGVKITIEAERDTIRHIFVEDRAESLYRVADEKGLRRGVNSISGDRIDLYFAGDSLKKVTVKSLPGLCSGTYTPEKETASLKPD